MEGGMQPDDRYWETLNRLTSHEAMCEERSKTIFNRLESIDDRLDSIHKNLFVIALTILSGMGGLILTLLLQ
jgi:hypothetical protein